jgi:hypothetical protein
MDAPPPTVAVAAAVAIACAGCHVGLSLVGTQPLRSTGSGEPFGALGGLFADCDRLDVYVCPRCGRVELFVEGLSRQIREDSPAESVASSAGSSRSVVGTLFQEAWRLDQQEQWDSAIARYEHVLEKFPGTNFARDAERRLSQIKLKLGI